MNILYNFDGKPILVKNDNPHIENTTNIAPPNGLYEPIHFDEQNQKWVGTNKQDWLENLKRIQEESIENE